MMTNTPSPEKESRPQKKTMTLICSGLTPANIKIVQGFAKVFNATFLSAFSDDVTHVIVATDPETKLGQKTFKYIQGIAFKKYVISFQWVLDCLDENAILDEDDEKYDVLDPDIFECGARRSRKRITDLFENFAFYCLEPFSSISLADFKVRMTFVTNFYQMNFFHLCHSIFSELTDLQRCSSHFDSERAFPSKR